MSEAEFVTFKDVQAPPQLLEGNFVLDGRLWWLKGFFIFLFSTCVAALYGFPLMLTISTHLGLIMWIILAPFFPLFTPWLIYGFIYHLNKINIQIPLKKDQFNDLILSFGERYSLMIEREKVYLKLNKMLIYKWIRIDVIRYHLNSQLFIDIEYGPSDEIGTISLGLNKNTSADSDASLFCDFLELIVDTYYDPKRCEFFKVPISEIDIS